MTSQLDDFNEGCGEATPYLYSVANLEVTSGLVRRNVGAPMWMRGPGAVPGLYALESGMNELAEQLQMDPLQLRLMNDAEKDEANNNIPFSSRHLKECFETGAKKFGWEKRTAGIGSMRRDGTILGWGLAGASWVALRLPAPPTWSSATTGHLCVRCGTQDIGTGTYTVFAQVLSDKTGIPLDRIDVILGDTVPPDYHVGRLDRDGIGAQRHCRGRGRRDQETAKASRRNRGFAFANAKVEDVAFTGGRIHGKNQDPGSGMHFADLLTMARLTIKRGWTRATHVGRSEGEGRIAALVRRAVRRGGVGAGDRAAACEPRGDGDRRGPHHQSQGGTERLRAQW